VVRVIIIAASPALRLGLRHMLEEDTSIEVVMEAISLDALLPEVEDADILVIANPGMWSPAGAERLSQISETTGLLFLVEAAGDALPDPQVMSQAAWGVLSLDSSAEEIVAAVRALEQGLLVGAPQYVRLARASQMDRDDPEKVHFDQDQIETLTGREAEVLQNLAQGLANKQIALELGISEHTVKFHISSIYAKLGVASRTEAVREGVRRGLVTL
jgi:DNA-binding NarL/FixJ family response regulator